MRYSVQLSNRIFVKVYGFLSFAKHMGEYVDKNVSKNLRGKYNQQSATDALKTPSKRLIEKQQKQLVILLVIKLLLKLQMLQKIRRQL